MYLKPTNMTRAYFKTVYLLLLLPTIMIADVKSTDGQINFDTQSNGSYEMILNQTGLGIGITPAANLHVNGNAIIPKQLFIGGSSGSANLNLHGTLGHGIVTLTTDANLDLASLYMADTSSGNIIATLPYAGNALGRVIQIKKASNLNRLEIYASSENIIDGRYKSLSLSSGFPSIELISDGSLWYITQFTQSGNLDWTPEEIDTTAWYDSSDTSTVVLTAGNVSQWNDKSGNNRHATQVDPEDTPVYGDKAIDFNGAQFLRVPGEAVTFGNAGIFVVSEGTSGYFIGSTLGDAGGKSRCYITKTHARFGRNDGGQQDHADLTDISIKTLRSAVNSDTPSPLDIFGYTNGTLTGTESQYTYAGLTNPNQLYFGCRSTNSSENGTNYSGFLTGKIYEVIITSTPDTNTRERIEGYLAWKWGLQDSLDAAHTYKDSPPLR
jgi:hypothetical protein